MAYEARNAYDDNNPINEGPEDATYRHHANFIIWKIVGDQVLCFRGRSAEACESVPLTMLTMKGLHSLLLRWSDKRFRWMTKVAIADLVELAIQRQAARKALKASTQRVAEAL
jgi:hypothetical protein